MPTYYDFLNISSQLNLKLQVVFVLSFRRSIGNQSSSYIIDENFDIDWFFCLIWLQENSTKYKKNIGVLFFVFFYLNRVKP